MLPSSGDVLLVGPQASVQFNPPIIFRVIRVLPYSTYEGWVWLDGYQLNSTGDAVERRSIFVQIRGLRKIEPKPDPRSRNGRTPAAAPGLRSGNISRPAAARSTQANNR